MTIISMVVKSYPTSIEATGPGRGQASMLICASPWIDSLAHTFHYVIPRYKGHNCIISNDPEIKIV
jgi:hypothetical protein